MSPFYYKIFLILITCIFRNLIQCSVFSYSIVCKTWNYNNVSKNANVILFKACLSDQPSKVHYRDEDNNIHLLLIFAFSL
ncbi:MAG TPA: hypothetical protein PLN45_03185 [Exilispira sp.]|nr:hypothetical protein [Spirochaetota bacterium]HPO60532.1 hypothetical protein [Exilispira sp.]